MSDLFDSRTNAIGIACAIGAGFFFSVNDVVIKFLSGDYPLHQVVLLRATIGMAVLLGLLAPLSGGFAQLKTRRLGAHLIRGLCVVFANMTFFLGLAVMPLADAVAIFFVSPLVITTFSVVFLGEAVGPRRWIAVVIPTVIDQNPCAHLRMPRDMIFHGWSMRLFQAWQHSATMSS